MIRRFVFAFLGTGGGGGAARKSAGGQRQRKREERPPDRRLLLLNHYRGLCKPQERRIGGRAWRKKKLHTATGEVSFQWSQTRKRLDYHRSL